MSEKLQVYVEITSDWLLALFVEGGTCSTGKMLTPGRKTDVIAGLPPGSEVTGVEFLVSRDVVRLAILAPPREGLNPGDVVVVTHQSTVTGRWFLRMRAPGIWWFRIFGWGFWYGTDEAAPPMFSNRGLRIPGATWRMKVLWPGDLRS